MASRTTLLGKWRFWVVAVSAGITLGACGAANAAASVIVTRLTALAQQMAVGADDANVTDGNAVLTTRQAAITAASGDVVNTDQRAYLVQVQGHFTGLDASVPSGSQLPTGTYLTFVFDPSDGRVTDWGISNRKADLSALGSVIPLSW
jgi:hypothetical protein